VQPPELFLSPSFFLNAIAHKKIKAYETAQRNSLRRFSSKVAKLSDAQKKKALQDAGIITKNGELTPFYRLAV
jgi:hypothetical protein